VTRSAVLILAEDPLAAALIGAAVELIGFEPAFATDGEPLRGALMRVRPRLVLVDCDHQSACGPSFIGPALMTGARVVLLGSRHSRNEPRTLAGSFGVRTMTLPADLDVIAGLLTAELEAPGRQG
jgi:hypothetical protein